MIAMVTQNTRIAAPIMPIRDSRRRPMARPIRLSGPIVVGVFGAGVPIAWSVMSQAPSTEPDARIEQRVADVGNELRSEEHTSELQSRENLVCRLLLEKKKKAKCNVIE